MRLGLFGGSFDPPHVGHLLAASDAVEALELDRLVWIPAGVQPFKVGALVATPEQRAGMLEAMLEGDPRFAVDRVEIERQGLSYTVETLAHFAVRHPAAERFLLIGGDLLSQIGQWREAARIPQLATVVVLERGAGDEPAPPPFPVQRLRTRRVDVSSTEVRERVRAGLPITGFVTEAVARQIGAARLYR